MIGARKYERVPFSVAVEVKDLATARSCRGRSIDISRGGMGLYIPIFIAAGSRVRITMTLTRQGRPVTTWVNALVRRATAEDGGAILGVEFDAVLAVATQPDLCEMVDRQ
ncbi:MAG: PilZ domain-containing protein [Planctomycetaceae bacterium]|nr:PilZ domain-containing protein [Planctomycetaceae bacterium]